MVSSAEQACNECVYGAGREGRAVSGQNCLTRKQHLTLLGFGSFFRFFCLLLGPPAPRRGYHEMGRAAAVLLSDPVSWAGMPV